MIFNDLLICQDGLLPLAYQSNPFSALRLRIVRYVECAIFIFVAEVLRVETLVHLVFITIKRESGHVPYERKINVFLAVGFDFDLHTDSDRHFAGTFGHAILVDFVLELYF